MHVIIDKILDRIKNKIFISDIIRPSNPDKITEEASIALIR